MVAEKKKTDTDKMLCRGLEQQKRAVVLDHLPPHKKPVTPAVEGQGFAGLCDPVLLALALSGHERTCSTKTTSQRWEH